MDQALNYGRLEVVQSRDKQLGWDNYLATLDGLLRNPVATADELRTIHRAVASHAVSDMSTNAVRESLLFDLYTLDREDGKKKQVEFLREFESRSRFSYFEHPSQVFRAMKESFTEVCRRDTQVELNAVVPGELRRLGRRKIRNGDWATAFHAHSTFYNDAEENQRHTWGQFFPKAYYGLSVGLDAVYGTLCQRYDKEMSERRTGSLDERLVTEGFLQLVGTRLLHPFWDGNGRTFAAHISLMLEREGIPVRDMNIVSQIIPPLTELTENLLPQLLREAGVDYAVGEEHFSMHFDHRFRQDYMNRLRTALLKFMTTGLDPSNDVYSFFTNAGWQIRRALIKNGLIPAKSSDTKRIDFEERMLQTLPEEKRQKYIVFVPHSEENFG